MSHNAILSIKVNDMVSAQKAAFLTGYTLQKVDSWQNRYGGITYNNASKIIDPRGRLAGVISAQGEIITDTYYMNGKLDAFLREYNAVVLETTAQEEGGWMSSRVEEDNGDLVVTICLP